MKGKILVCAMVFTFPQAQSSLVYWRDNFVTKRTPLLCLRDTGEHKKSVKKVINWNAVVVTR